MKAFQKDSSALNAALKKGPYQKLALVPPSPWLDDDAPASPKLEAAMVDSSIAVSWTHENAGDVFRYVIYYKYGNSWEYTILNKSDRSYTIPLSRTVVDRPRARRGEQPTVTTRVETLSSIAISAVDRTGNESEFVYHSVIQPTAPAVQ